MRPKNRTNRDKLSSGFNDEDRQQLTKINATIKKLIEEVEYLKEEVEANKLKYEEIKIKAEKLQQIAKTFFKVDKLEQYGRRQNIRILGVAQRTDDGEEVVTKAAEALNVEFNPELDIQRVHRLGKKRSKGETTACNCALRFIQKKNGIYISKIKIKTLPTSMMFIF